MNKSDNKEVINDEKELDSLFDHCKRDKLTKAVRKAKWHSILRTTLVSVVVLAIMFAVGGYISNALVYKMEGPVQIATDHFNNISAPNKYIGKVYRYHSVLSGKTEYTTFKIIQGKVVYTGQGEYHYGLLRPQRGDLIGIESPSMLGASYDVEDLKRQRYNELGQREMVFFYPFINYQTYRNDIKLLDNIGPDRFVEMALSFDKPYSIEEVKTMMPQNITLTWYWVDELNQQEKENSKFKKAVQKDPNPGTTDLDSPAKIRSEWTAYGIKTLDANGEPIRDPEFWFINSLKNGKEYDTRYKGEFERVYNNMAGSDGKLTKEDIKVQGVVVTGDAEQIKSIGGLPFIKASSLGVVTDKY